MTAFVSPPSNRSNGSGWTSAAWTVTGGACAWAIVAAERIANRDDAVLYAIAIALGCLAFAVVRWSPIEASRVVGIIPPATIPLFGSLGLGLAFGQSFGAFACLSVGLLACFGAIVRHWTSLKYRGVRLGWSDYLLLLSVVLIVIALKDSVERLSLLAIIAAALFAYAWIRLFRPFFELAVESVVRRNYRVAASGPGTCELPLHGPLIVIANHACWWDPLFLAKSLPRPVTPMMTSLFYDKWFIKPLVKYVFGTIRVEDARVRREAPEIQEAIRALDRGDCVMLFPESFLRRKEEIPLRRFGRGIWEILKERPDTPVVACWIEGAWGSYASFWNGPPTKNKPKEGRRSITIGMSAPFTVPAEKLGQHLAARTYLMNEVSAARTHLGLAPLPPFELPTRDDEPPPEQSA